MRSKHYDIAILGGSLGARISAALLAKMDRRVLFLDNLAPAPPVWFLSSIFLERILDMLGGRSCFVPRQPLQILSSQARVTISDDHPLEKELKREFGGPGRAVSEWLCRLAAQGEKLERVLWENGGLPWPSLKAATRFKLLCMRRKINWPGLESPVDRPVNQFPLPIRTFLTDFLQGLTLRNIEQLSQAAAALVLSQAMRPETIRGEAFSGLLDKRIEQFHGLQSSLEDLEQLDFDGANWTHGRMKDGSQFSAETFLLGDVRLLNRFAAATKDQWFTPQELPAYRTSGLSGQLSPLLASRVICGGEIPLRLVIEHVDDQPHGLVLAGGSITEQNLRQQLETALPFARYQMTELAGQPGSFSPGFPGDTSQGLASLPLRIGGNFYWADSGGLMPELGPAGAALLAWTLAENLAGSRFLARK